LGVQRRPLFVLGASQDAWTPFWLKACIPPIKDDELPGEPNNTSTATVIDNLTSTDNPITTGYMTTEDSTTTTTTKTRNKVLLQTAITYAQGENGSNPIPVRLLLNSGSQRSYITNSLKKRLGLVPTRTETLNLNTFGDDHFKKRRCDIVQLSLKGNSGNRKITALCFPNLCSPLTTTIDLSLYPHLQDLQLSDLNILEGRQSDSSIDILIGADYYFDIREFTIHDAASSTTRLQDKETRHARQKG
jgi:hypothetical protein